MWLIGRRCKCGNALSWPILIGRGLDLTRKITKIEQRVSLDLWNFFWFSFKQTFGDNSEEVTPVPIPNTVVKLLSADDTWWATARESRTSPEHLETSIRVSLFLLFLWDDESGIATSEDSAIAKTVSQDNGAASHDGWNAVRFCLIRALLSQTPIFRYQHITDMLA